MENTTLKMETYKVDYVNSDGNVSTSFENGFSKDNVWNQVVKHFGFENIISVTIY